MAKSQNTAPAADENNTAPAADENNTAPAADVVKVSDKVRSVTTLSGIKKAGDEVTAGMFADGVFETLKTKGILV